MSERAKDDGLLVGILVVLLLVVVGAVGFGGFMFIRLAHVREAQARMAAERALMAEQQARATAEALRAQAEAAQALLRSTENTEAIRPEDASHPTTDAENGKPANEDKVAPDHKP